MMMADHMWLLRPDELYIKDRYILLLGPDRGNKTESPTDRRITDLQGYVEDRVKKSDDDILKKLGALEDRLAQVQDQQAFGQQDLQANVEAMKEKINQLQNER